MHYLISILSRDFCINVQHMLSFDLTGLDKYDNVNNSAFKSSQIYKYINLKIFCLIYFDQKILDRTNKLNMKSKFFRMIYTFTIANVLHSFLRIKVIKADLKPFVLVCQIFANFYFK